MNPESIKAPDDISNWTPEEEKRIAEIIAGFNAAEVSRINSYSTLRTEAIRRMCCEQRKNAPMSVLRVRPIMSKSHPSAMRRDRRFERPRKHETSAARRQEYRRRLLQDSPRTHNR